MSLSLNCLIHGEVQEKMFTVKIEKTENISILKKLIKEENSSSFGSVDPKNIDLWMVNLRLDELGVEPVHVNLDIYSKLSPPRMKLSSFFDGTVDDERLHIIAEAPASVTQPVPVLDPTQLLLLNCLVLGDDLEKIFTVKIPKTDNVSILKKLIKEENSSSFGNVDPKNINLWKVSIPMDDNADERLKKISNLEPLKPLLSLSHEFPHVDESHVHILVQAPTNNEILVTKVAGELGEEERRDHISALHKRFETLISRILKATAPADSAKSSMYIKSQIAYSIYDGRYKADNPRTSVAPPIQLFNPVFGHFLDDINSHDHIPDDMIIRTIEYMKAASAIYSCEDKRREQLMPLLSHILDVDIQTILNTDKTNADGIVELVKSWGRILILLEEDKNEFGDGGSDPSTQAGLSAGRCWAQSRFEKLRYSTSCPIFLIATAGPWIAILGAVITDSVIVQRLTDYIWVGLDSVLNESHITKVARIFYALKASLGKLNSYYEEVQPAGDSPADSRYFPSITAYPHSDGFIDFKYVGFLENSLDCTTLRAQTTTEPVQDIVVKFVDRYGERAHRVLAAEGLAPKLFFCGSPCLSDEQPSYRSLSMVVMEYIDGKTLAQVKEEMNARTTEKVRLELQPQVQHAVDLLHDYGLVFGDLRPPNVMITEAHKVKLIDFNWAGEKGQAKYPYLISPGVDWPEGVKALAIIETDHDLDMLRKLFGKPAPY